MDIWQLIVIIGALGANTIAFIWLASHYSSKKKKSDIPDYRKAAEQDVEHIFSTEFREELRNRGRLHFEKIIGDNAMFLQQDLRLTTSQLNEYLKAEITRKLQEEFQKYEQSISDAKQLAIEAIDKTQTAIEQQRQAMSKQLEEELTSEKQRLLKRFEDNLADVVNHYLMNAIGDQIDLTDQLEFIIGDLEANKEDIIRDVTNAT